MDCRPQSQRCNVRGIDQERDHKPQIALVECKSDQDFEAAVANDHDNAGERQTDAGRLTRRQMIAKQHERPQGDEQRRTLGQPGGQAHRLVGAAGADVHVHAEHREQLGQVAELALGGEIALLRVDALLVPFLERVRAAARDRGADLERRALHRGADVLELFGRFVVGGQDRGRDFQHRGRDFRRVHPGLVVLVEQAQDVGRGREQVEGKTVKHHQFELDAHGADRRVLEVGQVGRALAADGAGLGQGGVDHGVVHCAPPR